MKKKSTISIRARLNRSSCLRSGMLNRDRNIACAYLPNRSAVQDVSHPATAGLTFAERVSYQRAIEEVYWRHRIWPKENPNPKPSLECGDDSGAAGKESRKTTERITDAGGLLAPAALLPSSYKTRRIGWRSTRSSRRYCASFLKRSATIPLSSRNVSPGHC